MYFWNIKALKAQIKRGELDDKETLPYFVVSNLLLIFLFDTLCASASTSESNMWDTLSLFADMALLLVGILYAYKKNGGARGRNFIRKYIALSLVVGVRFFLFFMLLLLVIILPIETLFFPSWLDSEAATPDVVLLDTAWQALFYYRIAKHIEETATQE